MFRFLVSHTCVATCLDVCAYVCTCVCMCARGVVISHFMNVLCLSHELNVLVLSVPRLCNHVFGCVCAYVCVCVLVRKYVLT